MFFYRMFSYSRWFVLTSLLVGALGCGGGESESPDNGGADGTDGVTTVVKSSLERLTPPAGAETVASEDLGQFAWDFYEQVQDTSENFVYSPYSIGVASAMLSAGAAADTLAQIQSALRFSETGDPLHEAHNALSLALSSRNHEGTEEQNAQALRISNDFWMLPALSPSDAFLDPLAQHYGAVVHLAPFDEEPEQSRQAINKKVSEDTGQLIPELLPKGSIDSMVVFVLTNALYFKARWATEFAKAATEPGDFFALDGSTQQVQMMAQTEFHRYLDADGFEAVSLAYDSYELEMVFIVPDAGQFETVAAGLTADEVANIVDSLQQTRLELKLPKLEISSDLPLKTELQAAGMVDAFEEGVADFRYIADNVFISDAFHQARLILDEEGTEAAAATAFVGSTTGEPTDEPVPVTIDRPFVFFIRDIPTGAVLFLGHFVKAD